MIDENEQIKHKLINASNYYNHLINNLKISPDNINFKLRTSLDEEHNIDLFKIKISYQFRVFDNDESLTFYFKYKPMKDYFRHVMIDDSDYNIIKLIKNPTDFIKFLRIQSLI